MDCASDSNNKDNKSENKGHPLDLCGSFIQSQPNTESAIIPSTSLISINKNHQAVIKKNEKHT